MDTILRTMLQRLTANLASGPGLQARPHNSRQRVDLMDLRLLQGPDPSRVVAALLANPERSIDFPVSEAAFQAAETADPIGRKAFEKPRAKQDPRAKLLTKLREIAEDAVDYYNDHGEPSLFIGFPLVSLQAVGDSAGKKSGRVLAPVLFLPLSLKVRRGSSAGVSLQLAGAGSELVVPNLALMAWLEQQSGVTLEGLFADEAGDDPWREIREVIEHVTKAAKIKDFQHFSADTNLVPSPRADEVPDRPTLLHSAVLGLFPITNPGLLRDTAWMIETESSLDNPVKPFLSPEAIADREDAEVATGDTSETVTTNPPKRKDFTEELLVTHSDPCQAEAVSQARRNAAVVIHGPPGTGKSQTIVNIIGDHLARGQRVLFVCDKRTALDVVKYRLDSVGLGSLCGVIHDPQRDRRDFYLSLRERLENLAQEPTVPDPAGSLDDTNRRLNALHGELRGYFDRLHIAVGADASFHRLCGEWFTLQAGGHNRLPEIEGLTSELIRQYRADSEEIIRRAGKAHWPENPFRDRVSMSLNLWLETTPGKVRTALERVAGAAAKLDETADEHLVPLGPTLPLPVQAQARRSLAAKMEAVLRLGLPDVAARLAADRDWRRWSTELSGLSEEAPRLGTALDREFVLQAGGKLPVLRECNTHLQSLGAWRAIAGSLKRLFALGVKSRAKAALTPLALGLEAASLERATAYYAGLRARYLWADLRDRVLGAESRTLPEDRVLIAFRDGLAPVLDLLMDAAHPDNVTLRDYVLSALADFDQMAGFGANLSLSADRAEAIATLEVSMTASELFSSACITELSSVVSTKL